VPFDRDKLVRSLQISLRKRPVDPERVEKMVPPSYASRKRWRRGDIVGGDRRDREEHLRQLDDVAYVRFASVYRNFREAKDFEAVLGELSGDDDARMPCYANDLPHSEEQFAQKSRLEGCRPALHAVGIDARRRAGPHLAQSRVGAVVVKDGVIVGALDPSRRPSARRTRALAQAGEPRAAPALCDAGAMFACRQVATVR